MVMMDHEERKRRKSETDSSSSKKKKKITVLQGVKISMEDIIDCCISLVADSQRPFSAINDPGFQRIIQALLNAMPAEDKREVSSYTVRNFVVERARAITDQVKKDLNGRLIGVKVDSASRGTRTFLGINAQYIQDGKVVLRTLALKEMVARSTSDNIKKVIEEVLHEYGVPIRNVYSFTSDNGANMVLAGQLLRKLASDIDTVDPNDVEEPPAEQPDEEDLASDEDGDDDMWDEEDDLPLRSLIPIQQETGDNLLSCSLADTGNATGEVSCSCIRCAAHCLQLAVSDAMNDEQVQKLVNKMRKLARQLRTKNAALLLKDKGHNIPKLDNETRWNSTVDMLQSLVPLRDFCTKFRSTAKLMKISDVSWRRVETLIDALKPSKFAMKKLQEEQLLMGDFYGAWLKCKMQTKNIDSSFSQLLVAAMERREQLMMHEPAFVAALYMDPRYFFMLSNQAISVAEAHLVTLWGKLEQLKGSTTETTPANTEAGESDGAEDEEDELEQLLAAADQGRTTNPGCSTQYNIIPRLKWLISQPRLRPATANVLEYWESQRYKQPELYALAMVALAVPATQVSVERLFSAMKYTLSDRRLSLKGDILECLLRIRQYNLWTRRHQTFTDLQLNVGGGGSVSSGQSSDGISEEIEAVQALFSNIDDDDLMAVDLDEEPRTPSSSSSGSSI